MSILNLANCNISGNTGIFPCAFSPGIYKRFMAIPKGTVIPATTLADTATLKAYIISKLSADTAGARWHMSGILSNIDNKTDAVKTEDRDGQKYVTQTPPYIFEWIMTVQFAQFIKWKGYQFSQGLYDYLYIDDAGNLIGAAKADAVGAAGLGGISLTQFYVGDQMPATASTLTTFKIMHNIEQNVQLNAGIGLVQAYLIPGDFENLLVDVTISAGTTTNTATHTYFTAKFNGIGAVSSVSALYGTPLAAAGALVMTDNGSPLVPSAVSYDDTNDQWDATHSSITAGHTVTVKFAAPSVLTATPYFLNIISETAYSYTSP